MSLYQKFQNKYQKYHKENKEYEYPLWVSFLILLALGLIGCCFTLYGKNSEKSSDYSYWWLFMGVLPVFIFLLAIKGLPKKFSTLRKDINKRWEKYNSLNAENIQSNKWDRFKKGFKSLFRLEFGITLLSTPKNVLIPFLGQVIFIIWSFGWGLYTVAIWSDVRSAHSITGTLLYAAMSSLDLFFFDINGNVIDKIWLPNYGTAILTGLISITSVLASLALGSIILGMFLTRIVNYLKAKRISVNPDSNNHLYIFFNQNETTEFLAKDIQKSDPRGVVVMVHTATIKDDEEDGWKYFFSLFASKDRMDSETDLDEKRLHLHTSVSIEEAADLINNEKNLSIWQALRLDTVERFINEMYRNSQKISVEKGKILHEDPLANHINLFFFSTDRDKNVLNSKIMADNLEKDLRLKAVAKTIFCSSRQDSVTSIIEDRYISQIRIKILDDSRLALKELIRKPEFHPIRFVDIDTQENPGAIDSKFTSLIIGFGETGRDAFRFLYEFGAFLNKESLEIDGKKSSVRSPFECHIVDPGIQATKNNFIANAPSIFKHPIPGDKNDIIFHEFDHTSEGFFKMLEEISGSLNYVVVATGDDERNITIAKTILDYIRRKRGTNDLNHFKIFVRTYEKESFSHLDSIVNYTRNLFREEDSVKDYLVVFGKKEDIYTFELVIDDRETVEAGNYHNQYEELAQGVKPKEGEDSEWIKLWKKLDYDYYKSQTKPHKQEKKPEALADIKRMIDESRKNSLHAPTKRYVLEYVWNNGNEADKKEIKDFFKYLEKNPEESLQKRYDLLKQNALKSDASLLDRLLYNLCKQEHIRWNASHQLRGFIFGDKKNLVSRTHDCLTIWENLPDDSQRYDYPVVETSIKLDPKKNTMVSPP